MFTRALRLSIFAFLPTLVVACSHGAAETTRDSDEGALRAVSTTSLECAPVDPDEACVDASDVGEYCIGKITLKAGELVVERKSSSDTPLPSVRHSNAVSFVFGAKKLNASWNGGETWLSATRRDTVSRYAGQLALEHDMVVGVECKVAGTQDLPSYLKTVPAWGECNGKNPQGQKLRCVVGASCLDGEGDEVALLQSTKGICQPSLQRTAKLGEACNVNPPGSAAVVMCERAVGLKCTDAQGAPIALAERNAPAGTCQR